MTAVAAPPHSTRKHRAWQETISAALLLWGLTVAYFWPQLAGGRVLYWGDIGLYFSPMLSFLHESLRQGRIPLWNPWILCGAPYVGNPQTWPLYPVSVLLNWLDGPAFINWTIALHIWLAALGTFLLLRHVFSRSPVAASLGAIVFAFGGQLVSKEQFPNMVQAAAYLPWVLWMVHRLLTRRQTADAVWLGLTLGLQLLAAHAQITLLTLYLATAYGLFLLLSAIKPKRAQLARLIVHLGIAGVVAAGLAAGQLLPTAELYRDAWRQRLSFRIVDRFYLPWKQLGNFVLPTLHGHPLHADFTARGNFWETCCFVGWIAFLLAGWGACAAWRSQKHSDGRFWAVVFFVGLLLALGGQNGRGGPAVNGMYWLAYRLLPGFRSFHDPARCLLWCGLALAVLASGGLEAFGAFWIKRPAWRPLALLLAAASFAELLVFGRSLYPLADPASLRPVTAMVAAVQSDPEVQAHQARFLAPDSARVWQRFTGHRSFRQTVPDYQALWADTLTPNLMMPYGLPDAYGYEPVTRRDTQTIAGTAAHAFQPDAKPSERRRAATWAGFLGVRDVILLRVDQSKPPAPGLSPRLTAATLVPLGKAVDPARLVLSQNERWQPRARLMTDFRSVPSDREAQALLTRSLLGQNAVDLGKTVIVTGRVPFPSAPGPIQEAALTDDGPDRVEITAKTAAPALLVLADSRHPGWQATVNGVPVPILTANDCLRAVALPQAGASHIVFSDRPTSFLVGLYGTLLTAGGLTALGVGGLVRGRKNS